MSVLQEVLQVVVVPELFAHLLGSSFILVLPEDQTQNRGNTLETLLLTEQFFRLSPSDITQTGKDAASESASAPGPHRRKTTRQSNREQASVSLPHHVESLSLTDQYPWFLGACLSSEVWEGIGEPPVSLVDANVTVIRKLFHSLAV